MATLQERLAAAKKDNNVVGIVGLTGATKTETVSRTNTKSLEERLAAAKKDNTVVGVTGSGALKTRLETAQDGQNYPKQEPTFDQSGDKTTLTGAEIGRQIASMGEGMAGILSQIMERYGGTMENGQVTFPSAEGVEAYNEAVGSYNSDWLKQLNATAKENAQGWSDRLGEQIAALRQTATDFIAANPLYLSTPADQLNIQPVGGYSSLEEITDEIGRLESKQIEIANSNYYRDMAYQNAALGADEQGTALFTSANDLQAEMEKVDAAIQYAQNGGAWLTGADGKQVQIDEAGYREIMDYLTKQYGVGETSAALYQLYNQLYEQLQNTTEKLGEQDYDYARLKKYDARLVREVEATAQETKWKQQAEENPVGMALLARGVGLFRGGDYLGALFTSEGGSDPTDFATYAPPTTADMYATRMVSTIDDVATQKVRDSVDNETWEKIAVFAQQTGVSIVDSALATALFGKASIFVLGSSAAAQKTKDVIEQGGTREQALWGGAAAGVAEAVFEKFSVDRLLSVKSIAGFKSVVIETLKQSGVEISEEMATEVANILSDVANMGENSEFSRLVRKYMDEEELSKEEATEKAYMDMIEQVVLAGAGGFLSGLAMGGSVNLSQYAMASLAESGGRNSTGSTGERVTPTLETPALSVLEQAAAEVVSRGSVSNNTAERIMADEAAMEELGIDTNGMTKSQTRNAVKDAVAAQNPTQENAAAEGKVSAPVQQEAAQTASEGEVSRRMEQAQRAAATFGENGSKAFVRAYDADTASTLSAEDAYAGFAKVYNAALKGETVESDLPSHMKLAAESAAQNDALRAEQAAYFGEASGLVKTGQYGNNLKKMNLSTKTERVLDAVARVAGVQVRVVDRIIDTDGAEINARYRTGVIEISSKSTNPVRVAFSHEIVHRIRETAPAAYEALSRFVQTHINSGVMRGVIETYSGETMYNTSDASAVNEEIVADAVGLMLGDSKAMEQFVKDDRNAAEKLLDTIRDLIRAVKRALNGQNVKLNETQVAAFSELLSDIEGFESALTDALNAIPQNEQKNTTREGGEQKESRKFDTEQYIGKKDIAAIQEIGRKSVNDFTSAEIAKTEAFARKYWNEMGVKSPFFRAWFGDWRVNDQTRVQVADRQGDARGIQRNADTGWDIQVSGKVFNETRVHNDSYNLAARPYLPNINDIVKQAVLLDSYTMDDHKSSNSLMMHSLYGVANIGNGPEIIKLYVEEMYNPNQADTAKRAYQLQNIEKYQPTGKSSQNTDSSISPAVGTIQTIADLFAAVKRMDKNFNPNPPSKAAKDDKPLVVYHGTGKEFTVFDRGRAGENGRSLYGDGFYFSDKKGTGKGYGGRVVAAYLNMKNPYYASEADAGRLSRAALEQKGYDGVIIRVGPSERHYVVFDSGQIKSASDNIGTFDGANPDIRYSRKFTPEAEQALRETVARYVERYGTIPAGENPAREVSVPRRTSDDKKVSQTVRTIMEAGATPDEALPTIEEMIAEEEFSYEVYGDEAAIEDANSYIENMGWGEASRKWFDAMRKGEVSKRNTAIGWTLYNNAVNAGDMETAIDVLNAMVEHQRNAAQALQATRILKKLSPETQLYAAQKSVSRLQEELNERYGSKKKGAPQITIAPELAEELINASDQKGRDEALKKIYLDVGRQLPSRFIDKWNAWRYLSMLGNARTHVRNIVGNAAFAPVVTVKNLTASAIESAVNRVSGGRTGRSKALVTGFTKADRALLSAAWADYANVEEAALGGGKYSDSANTNKYIEEGRRVFGRTEQAKTAVGRVVSGTVGRAVEAGRKGNSKLLDVEDKWFSKPHYAAAMASYCKANGITAEQIRDGTGVDAARAYAMKEAQKATYRDTNALSTAISQLGRYDGKNAVKKGISTVMEGILPFRKTPANILARGLEYSPLGLVKSLSYDMYKVSRGDMTAAEMIDNLSAGLTGTGLLALGVFLAAQGLIRGHGGDDEEKREFEELMGHQNYSLEVGGESVTLDWLAPECLPFFVGVNLWETTQGAGEEVTLSAILSAVGTVTEPLLEMSCLQSLNEIFDAVGYAQSEGLSGLPSALVRAATSYLTQGVPTLLGQVERSGQGERMTTYTEKNDFLTGDMQYTLGSVSGKIPGVDYNQIAYIDAWGRTENTGGVGERMFNNMLNPAYTSDIEISPMEEELLRLYEATGEAGVFPDRAAKSFTVNGERKDLTAEEHVKYAQTKGQAAYSILTELTASAEYSAMSDGEKSEAVALVHQYANAVGKAAVSDYAPEGWIGKAIRTTKLYGISKSQYVLLYCQQKDIESLKENGETIANSKGLLIMEAVYGVKGLSDSQRKALFQDFGVGQRVIHYNKAAVAEQLREMRKRAD